MEKKPEIIAYLEIKHCKDCPFKKTANQWSSDGWDRMEDWICTKAENKKIEGAVEWHEEKDIKIPEWCPLSSKPQQEEKIKAIREEVEMELNFAIRSCVESYINGVKKALEIIKKHLNQ